MPSVSVIITTFNRGHYLKKAIQSALEQTLDDIEIVVSDDGGFEETRYICESFADARVRHIVNKTRQGISMNTYAGIMQASSPLIALLNDDDRWRPEFLERCARPMIEDDRVVLAFCDHWLIDSEGTLLTRETEENTACYGRDSLTRGYVAQPLMLLATNSIPLAMGSVFRKSAVDWNIYTGKIEGAYDYFLAYCLLKSHGKVFYEPDLLTEYRVHGGSASAQFNLTNTLGAVYISRLVLSDPKFHAISGTIRKKVRSLERHLVKAYLYKMKLGHAMQHGADFLRDSILYYTIDSHREMRLRTQQERGNPTSDKKEN